jgi:glycosyltransferase involved in cell wall biosynthesis
MARIGQNPAKSITHVAKPQDVTAAVITYIPFLSGYYAQSLDVLKICLTSLREHADLPLDLMVFDNASCPEVRNYLTAERDAGKIQYLVLSDRNIGKVGAWNFIFGAAPGEYIAYADSDVYFYPGWLSRHLEVFAAFPEAGTVSGLPRRGRRTFYTGTIERAAQLPDVRFEEGHFIPDAWIVDHARSLGKLDTVADDLKKVDYRLTRGGVSAYATATHFQFMVRRETIRPFLPFPYDRPMGDSVANLDRAIDGSGYLRLAVSERAVKHLGNTLDAETLAELPERIRTAAGIDNSTPPPAPQRAAFFEWKPVRWFLHHLYDWIFQIYYRSGS